VSIWALGDMVPLAVEAAGILNKENIGASVVNARFIRPLDTALLEEQGRTARTFVTIENGIAAGGFGSAVEEFLGDRGWTGRVLRIGWPDRFIPHGSHGALLKEYGFTAAAIADKVRATLK
jgi:1-deoxy-D-xylulose-5-phosphate synthase